MNPRTSAVSQNGISQRMISCNCTFLQVEKLRARFGLSAVLQLISCQPKDSFAAVVSTLSVFPIPFTSPSNGKNTLRLLETCRWPLPDDDAYACARCALSDEGGRKVQSQGAWKVVNQPGTCDGFYSLMKAGVFPADAQNLDIMTAAVWFQTRLQVDRFIYFLHVPDLDHISYTHALTRDK